MKNIFLSIIAFSSISTFVFVSCSKDGNCEQKVDWINAAKAKWDGTKNQSTCTEYKNAIMDWLKEESCATKNANYRTYLVNELNSVQQTKLCE